MAQYSDVEKGTLCTGGKDGAVKLWNKHLEIMHEFSMSSLQSPPTNPHIRSVCWDQKNGQ